MESGSGDDYLDFVDFSLFYILPNEIVISIFRNLSVKELCTVIPSVCKQWYIIANDNSLWKELYLARWNTMPLDLRSHAKYPTCSFVASPKSKFAVSKWLSTETIVKPTKTSRKADKISLLELTTKFQAEENLLEAEDSGDDSGDESCDEETEGDMRKSKRHSTGVEASRFSPRMARRKTSSNKPPTKSEPCDSSESEYSSDSSSSSASSGPPTATDITPITSDDEGDDCFEELRWKGCFVNRLLGEQNWKGGNYTVSTLKGHSLAVMCVKFRESALFSCSLDSTLKRWDMQTKRCVSTFSGHQDWVNFLDFDDGKLVVDRMISCSYDTSLKVWDIKSTECLSTLWGHQNIVWAVKVSGNRALSCSSDSTVKLWDIEAGICLNTMGGHAGSVYCFDVDWSRNVVVSGSVDKTIRFWDLNSIGDSKGGCLHTLAGHEDRLCCLQYDADLSLVASGSRDSTIKLWDARRLGASHQKTTTTTKREKPSRSASKSAAKNAGHAKRGAKSSKQASSPMTEAASNGDASCLKTLRGHKGRVCCLQFDDYKIVSGSDDNEIKVWPINGSDCDASSCILTLKDHDCWVNSLFFEENILVSGAADDTVKVWDFSKQISKKDEALSKRARAGTTFALKERCTMS